MTQVNGQVDTPLVHTFTKRARCCRRSACRARPPRLAIVLFVLLTTTGVAHAAEPTVLLQQAITAACEPSTLEQLAARLSASTGAADEPIVVRGAIIGRRRQFTWPGSHELIIERIAPYGQLRRLLAE